MCITEKLKTEIKKQIVKNKKLNKEINGLKNKIHEIEDINEKLKTKNTKIMTALEIISLSKKNHIIAVPDIVNKLFNN